MSKLIKRSEREELEVLFVMKELRTAMTSVSVFAYAQDRKRQAKSEFLFICNQISDQRTRRKKKYEHVNFILDDSFKNKVLPLIEDWNGEIETIDAFLKLFDAVLEERLGDWYSVREIIPLEKPEQNLPILSTAMIRNLLADDELRESIFSFFPDKGRGVDQYASILTNVLKSLYNGNLDVEIAEFSEHGFWSELPLFPNLTPAQALAQLLSPSSFSEQTRWASWLYYQDEFCENFYYGPDLKDKFRVFTDKLEKLKEIQQTLFPYGATLISSHNHTAITLIFDNKADADSYSEILKNLAITEESGIAKCIQPAESSPGGVLNYSIILTQENLKKIMGEYASHDDELISNIIATHLELIDMEQKTNPGYVEDQFNEKVVPFVEDNQLKFLAKLTKKQKIQMEDSDKPYDATISFYYKINYDGSQIQAINDSSANYKIDISQPDGSIKSYVRRDDCWVDPVEEDTIAEGHVFLFMEKKSDFDEEEDTIYIAINEDRELFYSIVVRERTNRSNFPLFHGNSLKSDVSVKEVFSFLESNKKKIVEMLSQHVPRLKATDHTNAYDMNLSAEADKTRNDLLPQMMKVLAKQPSIFIKTKEAVENFKPEENLFEMPVSFKDTYIKIKGTKQKEIRPFNEVLKQNKRQMFSAIPEQKEMLTPSKISEQNKNFTQSLYDLISKQLGEKDMAIYRSQCYEIRYMLLCHWLGLPNPWELIKKSYNEQKSYSEAYLKCNEKIFKDAHADSTRDHNKHTLSFEENEKSKLRVIDNQLSFINNFEKECEKLSFSDCFADNRELKSILEAYQPNMVSLTSIEPLVVEAETGLKINHGAATTAYYILEGVDAYALQGWSALKGGIIQAASQLNNLEFRNPEPNNPIEFAFDQSQGPAVQKGCEGLALARYYYWEKHGKKNFFIAEWEKDPSFSRLFEVKNGYMHPAANGEEKDALDFIKLHANDLFINIEHTEFTAVNQPITQALCAAFAFGRYDGPQFNQKIESQQFRRSQESLASLIEASEEFLKIQYLLLAKYAVLKSQNNPNERIPLVLTAVGGGVFDNPPQAIKGAIKAAIEEIEKSKGTNIDVAILAYSNKDVEFAKNVLHGLDFTVLSEKVLSLEDKKKTALALMTSSEEVARLMAFPTKADGDCAFHALLGEWNGTEFVKENANEIRRLGAEKISTCSMSDPLFPLILDSMLELIRGGINDFTYPSLSKVQQEINNSQKRFQDEIEENKNLLENEFRKNTVAAEKIDLIYKHSFPERNQNAPFFEKFIRCSNEKTEKTEEIIKEYSELNKLYIKYKEKPQDIKWDEFFSNNEKIFRGALMEYARFIRKERQYLLIGELHFFAKLLKINLVVYPDMRAQPMYFNSSDGPEVKILYNQKMYHYMRVKSSLFLQKMKLDSELKSDSVPEASSPNRNNALSSDVESANSSDTNRFFSGKSAHATTLNDSNQPDSQEINSSTPK